MKLQAERETTDDTSEIASYEFSSRDEDRGAPLTVQDQELQSLREPVQSATELLETGAQLDDDFDIEEPLRKLFTALQGAQEGEASPEVIDFCWHDAARAATAILRNGELSSEPTCFELARDVLFASARHRLPETRPDPASFDGAQSWNIPAPRIESASGLLLVAFREEPVTDEVLQQIKRLSADPSPEVRFVVARHLHLLSQLSDMIWSLVDEMKSDASIAVLSGVASSLSRMATSDNSERVAHDLQDLLERGRSDAPGAEELRNTCVLALAAAYIWHGGELAGDILREKISSTLGAAPKDFAHLSRIVRDAYALGDSLDNSSEAGIRDRAIEFSRILVDSSTHALHDLVSQLSHDSDDALADRIRTIAHIIDGVASDMFIVSGAHDISRRKEPELSSDQRDRLYRETAALLDLLSEVPIAGVTHHVLETLSVYVPFDPKGVFIRIAQTIEFGTGGDYQLDSIGATLIVGLLQRYLAEHRTLLQTDSECQDALIQILDTFVDAGWPEARRLTYGLEEIFR